MINVEIGESIPLSKFLKTDIGQSILLGDLAQMSEYEGVLPEPDIGIGELGRFNSQLSLVLGRIPYFHNKPYFPLSPPEQQQEEMERVLSMGFREAIRGYGKLVFSLTPDRRMDREALSSLIYAIYLYGPHRTFVNYGAVAAVGEEAHLHFSHYINPHEPILNQDPVDLIFPRDRRGLEQAIIAVDLIPAHLMDQVKEYRTSRLFYR